MPSIKVELNPDRTFGGFLTLLNDSGKVVAGPFPALGQASSKPAKDAGNPQRSPLLKNGDTPTGVYAMKGFLKTGDGVPKKPKSSYGPNGAIAIKPLSGDAKMAEDNGRDGLLIHGGDTMGIFLKPTKGCVRMFNDDMASLIAAIVLQDGATTTVSIVEKDVGDKEVTDPDVIDDGAVDPPEGLDEAGPFPNA